MLYVGSTINFFCGYSTAVQNWPSYSYERHVQEKTKKGENQKTRYNEQRRPKDSKVLRSDYKSNKIDRLAAFVIEGENPDLEKMDDDESFLNFLTMLLSIGGILKEIFQTLLLLIWK